MATALYRRYRPESFAEVIGQDHVTTPLRRALRAGRVGHAYLFSGPRGCGKTTSARILARCLNCAEGPTDTPCGTCDSCRDLARGGSGSLDVVEIDAASHGGVDDARELRERASFAPVRDRYKVFIIDEAHMVTSAGFNALLKLVEEPPEHVKFVFATTEPDKVIGTIRSRTHHYPFRLIPPQVLGPYLDEVCAAEGVQVGEGVMPLVVRAGGGSARDSMSVLDQLMAGAGEDGLDFPTAIALLGFTDTSLLDSAITAIAQRDAAALYAAVEHVLATGHEPRRFVEDLLERLRDLIVLAAVPDKGADLLPQVPADELESMRGQAAMLAPADLSQCGDLVHETLSTMSGATSPRLHLELLAARLVLRHERAALAAGEAGAPGAVAAGGGSAGGDRSAAPTGQGVPAATAQGAAPAPSGGREEARRIAQEKVEAARQARGGRAPGGAAPAQGAPAPSEPAPAAPEAPRQAPAETPRQAAAEAAAPSAQQTRESASWGTAAPSGPAQESAPQPPPQSAPRGDRPGAGADAPPPGGQRPWGDAVRSGDGGAAAQQAAPAGSAQQSASSAPSQDAAPSVPAPQAPPEAAPQAQAGPGAPQESAPPAQSDPAGGLDADAVRGHWSAILDELQQIRRPSWALISQNGHVHATRGSTLVLGFRTDGLVSAFHRGTAAENLADAVRRIMHTEITVEAVVGEDPGPGGGGGQAGGPGGGPSGGLGGGASSGPGGPSGAPSGGPGGGLSGGPGGGPSRHTGDGAGGPAPGGSGAPAGAPSGGGSAPWGAAAGAMTPRGGAPTAAAPASAASDAPGATAWAAAAPASSDADASAAAAGSATPAPAADAAAPESVSVGQRASERALRAAARAAQSGPSAAAPDRVEDFAPEPDDPYPPDPRDEDYSAPSPSAPGGGWAPAPQDPPQARPQGQHPGQPEPQSQGQPEPRPQSDSASQAPDGEVPVVEDEGRDSLPPEEPRTFGQAALRRALAEGRVIRSRPAPSSSAPEGAPDAPAGAPTSALSPASVETPSSAPASAASPHPAVGSASAPAAAPGAAPSTAWESSAAPAVAPSTSWSSAAAAPGPDRTPAPAPAGQASTQAPAAAPAPSAPRSGAALVREAAQASLSASQRARAGRGAPSAAPEAEADPTGGATRDDEDAVVSTRNGREVVEKLLGGKVLEIIDENAVR